MAPDRFKRVIQKNLQDPLAEMMLAGDIADGQTVSIAAASDRLLFTTSESEAEAA